MVTRGSILQIFKCNHSISILSLFLKSFYNYQNWEIYRNRLSNGDISSNSCSYTIPINTESRNVVVLKIYYLFHVFVHVFYKHDLHVLEDVDSNFHEIKNCYVEAKLSGNEKFITRRNGQTSLNIVVFYTNLAR